MYQPKKDALLCVACHKIANGYNNKYSRTTPLSHTKLYISMDELYNMEGASKQIKFNSLQNKPTENISHDNQRPPRNHGTQS